MCPGDSRCNYKSLDEEHVSLCSFLLLDSAEKPELEVLDGRSRVVLSNSLAEIGEQLAKDRALASDRETGTLNPPVERES